MSTRVESIQYKNKQLNYKYTHCNKPVKLQLNQSITNNHKDIGITDELHWWLRHCSPYL
jgi:hypothetical protein